MRDTAPTPFYSRLIAVTAVLFGLAYFASTRLSTTIDHVLRYPLNLVTEKHQQIYGNEAHRLRLLGQITHNPYVHFRISQIKEQDGVLASALEEMELAWGLLNMGNPDEEMRRKYKERLHMLREKNATP